MIMTITSPLLEKKEIVAMVMPFTHSDREETVIVTIARLLLEE